MNYAPVFDWTAETLYKPHAKPEMRIPNKPVRHILIRNPRRSGSGVPKAPVANEAKFENSRLIAKRKPASA
jgi:hypothetical protein